MHPTASIGPHEISGSRDWIPLWFYWGSGEAEWARPASIFRLSFVIHITLGLFLLSPQPPLVHISVQLACRMLKSQYFCSAQIYWISNIVIWQRYGEYPTLPGHWDHCPVGEMWKYFGKKKLEFFSWCLRQHFHANYRNEKCDVRSPTGRLNWVASRGWDIKSHQSSWLLTSNWLAFYQLFCQIFVGDQSDRH